MSALSDYLKSIEAGLQRGDSTEHTHRPALKTLLEASQQDQALELMRGGMAVG